MLPKNVCCPRCRGKLLEGNNHIDCSRCGMQFYRRDGIPVLLSDDYDKKKMMFIRAEQMNSLISTTVIIYKKTLEKPKKILIKSLTWIG